MPDYSGKLDNINIYILEHPKMHSRISLIVSSIPRMPKLAFISTYILPKTIPCMDICWHIVHKSTYIFVFLGVIRI